MYAKHTSNVCQTHKQCMSNTHTMNVKHKYIIALDSIFNPWLSYYLVFQISLRCHEHPDTTLFDCRGQYSCRPKVSSVHYCNTYMWGGGRMGGKEGRARVGFNGVSAFGPAVKTEEDPHQGTKNTNPMLEA